MFKPSWRLFAIFLLSAFFSISHAGGDIEWRNFSPAVFKSAKSSHKLVLVFAKVSWCRWCQQMDHLTFKDPGVVQLVSQRYIPVKVDIEKNKAFAKRYKITEIPYLIILNDRNQVLKRYSGYASAQSVTRELVAFSR